MITDKEYLRNISIGYDLDGGGYEFEAADIDGLRELPCAIWSDPDLDYMGLQDSAYDYYSLSCPILAFAPNSGHFEAVNYPERIGSGDSIYQKRSSGIVQGSDRDCNCQGEVGVCSGVSGMELSREQCAQYAEAGINMDLAFKNRVAWEYTCDSSDKPRPDCDRCDGTGYVDSMGGEWAIYSLVDDLDD